MSDLFAKVEDTPFRCFLDSKAQVCMPCIITKTSMGPGIPQDSRAWIPVVSRIVSVIDAYDAMVSNRCYRKGLPHSEAIHRLLQSTGTQFDAEVVHTFIPIAEQEAADVFAAAGTSTSAAL